jgi:membrane-associated phospholipid phosphatase
LLALLITAASTPPVAAQVLTPAPLASVDTARSSALALPILPRTGSVPHAVRWWEAAAVVGGVGALLADDSHLLEEVRGHPTNPTGDLAVVLRQAGDFKVYSALTLAALGTGLLAGNPAITRTGAQLAASGALAGVSFGLLKVVTGRARPSTGEGAYRFEPFGGDGSFPSGHTTMAFALATTLGDASHHPWVTAGLYTIAAGTAWSRVYDARHWPSDVFLGAAIGITAAKLVNGRWRLFGLKSPSFLVSPQGAGLQLSF